MLDAYIIERIQQERAERARRDAQIPLHIEPPRPARPPERRPEKETPDRGSVVIDFRV